MPESGSSPLTGIDHVALVAMDPEQTVRFYVDVLGLRAVDRPTDTSRAGSGRVWLGDGRREFLCITQSGDRQPGELGIGTIHHIAFVVEGRDTLLKWKRYLQHREILCYGPYDQQVYQDLILADPDGALLELATFGPGFDTMADVEQVYTPPVESMAPYRDEERIRITTWPDPVTEIEPDMAIRGLHHVATITSSLERTDAFYRNVLQLPLVRKSIDSDDPEVQRWYWGLDGGRPGALVTAFPIVHPGEGGTAEYGRIGPGVALHYALGLHSPEPAQEQLASLAADADASSTQDEDGNQAIAVRDPDGLAIELMPARPDGSAG